MNESLFAEGQKHLLQNGKFTVKIEATCLPCLVTGADINLGCHFLNVFKTKVKYIMLPELISL